MWVSETEKYLQIHIQHWKAEGTRSAMAPRCDHDCLFNVAEKERAGVEIIDVGEVVGPDLAVFCIPL